MGSAVPKPLDQRVRPGHHATHAKLTTTEPPMGDEPPELPKRGRRRWHALTQAWWDDVWRSPMAGEYLAADVHRLYLLAELIERFWRRPDLSLAAEIRLQGQCFGLTPIDRRRLQWEISRVDSARRSQPEPTRPGGGGDPRALLQVVS